MSGIARKKTPHRARYRGNSPTFLANKVPLYRDALCVTREQPGFWPAPKGTNVYRGTSLIRNSLPLGPYSRAVPRAPEVS